MKVDDYTFRQLFNNWVIFEKQRDIRRLKKFRWKTFPLLGYFFVDTDSELSLRLIGSLLKGKDEIKVDEKTVNDNVVIKASRIGKRTCELLDKNIIETVKGIKSIEANLNYIKDDQLNLGKTRLKEELDPFRDEVIVDDLLATYKLDNNNEENLWVTVEGLMKDDKTYICLLEEDSILDPKYKKGEMVGVRLIDNVLRIVGPLKPKE